MQFFTTISLLAVAALAAADNTITFISQDELDRTVYFTSNADKANLSPLDVPGLQNATIDIPWNWVGNFYSVTAGQPNVPGMLGEMAFNEWGGHTFFDVSAIVNPNDHNGVKKLWPTSGREPFSGCEVFPCNHAYYAPDDVQTKATQDTDFYCTLGTASGYWKRSLAEESSSPVYARDFVLNDWVRMD